MKCDACGDLFRLHEDFRDHLPCPKPPSPIPEALTTIASAWDDYRARVLPRMCSAVQVVETRRAFYAGASALMQNLVRGLEGGTEPTEKDLATVDALGEEIQAFARAIQDGEA